MRGKAVTLRLHFQKFRITPAHAGKSGFTKIQGVPDEDHPRPCGEKQHRSPAQPVRLGSPPPMRGKALRGYVPLIGIRITPAHAGKSLSQKVVKTVFKDHPRPCGEKFATLHFECVREGSPPPMRGKGIHGSSTSVPMRITPAHAGKSR